MQVIRLKKIYLLLILFASFIFTSNVDAKSMNMYLFYGDGCPHCAALEKYLNKKVNNKDLKLYKYEVWNNSHNQDLWVKVQEAVEVEARGVPYFVVGDEVVQGYNDTPAYERKIDNAIKNAKGADFNDNAGIALGIVKGTIKKKSKDKSEEKEEIKDDKEERDENKNKTLDIPLIGEVDISSLSIPIVAGLIGLVDGFNPCAMWILIFLITLLFDYPSRKKMWILGCSFLFTSAFVYFLFMISFLNLATFMNSIKILRLGIAVFALIFGGYNVYRYIKSRNDEASCDVVDKNKRKKIMVKTKKIVSNEKFILSLIGIIALAFSVNLIELMCSLGLPVMFTEILAYNNITGFTKIIYLLIYVIFFMLDDLIVFFIAMKTLKITAISNKYSKYSHLIGGIIMFIIGLLMIFRPEWLMFNF